MKPSYRSKVEMRQRRRQDEKDRTERIVRLKARREMLLAMCQEWEKVDVIEARRCLNKVRTIEQQLRYINDGVPP